MATQELVELKKIAKLLKKQIEPTIKEARKRAKKIKLKDLLKPENINERINNFMDKLTLDDGLRFISFIFLVGLIYPFVWNLKPRGFWEGVMKNARFLQIIGWIAIVPFQKEDPEFDMGCFGVSVITAYIFIYQGGNIKEIAKGVLAGML